MSIENPFNNPPQESEPKSEEQKPEQQEQEKQEEQETLPTVESTEKTEFTPEEIEEARKEMEAELLERKKVELVSKAALDSFNEDVNKMVVSMNRSLDGRAESVNVWEGLRQQLSSSARQEMAGIIGKLKTESDPNSMLGKLSETINQDVFEGPRQGMKIPEAIDRNPEVALVGYIKERGAELSGKDLEEVEQALKLAALNAQHKFFQWQHADQLENVIAAQEELSKLNDEFDPARAGFFELKNAVENGAASIRLDFNSKPNYRYAYPEYNVRNADCARMLSGLSRVEARQFLKDHDIELEEDSE
ncbi:MAG: hypothetical protein QF858_00615 [Candidatus Pacebacteria bacterium]|jgi:hypothetical protein|nr:hypothetical protein [Candidatus Paceibacterota bacterium]|tara:strand:+ start:1767 stop:2681 length:915 start_codon:yes stop_codon:yes gene_type:complete